MMSSYELTAAMVNVTFHTCLKREHCPGTELEVDGVYRKVIFFQEDIAVYQEHISGLIDQLPDTFRKPLGASFLDACARRDGQQWGDLVHVDRLLCLGLASGKLEHIFQKREQWQLLPGGMPYFKIISS